MIRAAMLAKIAAWTTRHGPATCGCVALNLWCREMLTYEQQARYPVRGWPLCPICQGGGVDPRIPVHAEAMT